MPIMNSLCHKRGAKDYERKNAVDINMYINHISIPRIISCAPI
jgi:fatty-acid desaturase